MDAFPDGQTLPILVIAFILAAFAFFFALRAGFFHLPSKQVTAYVRFFHVAGAFLIYLVLAFVILPALLVVISRPYAGPEGEIPEIWMNWGQIIFLLILFIALLGYCLAINRNAARCIFWGEEKPATNRFFKSFFMGVMAWIVSYPAVLFISSLAGAISLFVWGKSESEQVAVSQLKKTLDDPLLFSLMLLSVSILVPFMEELLFRGFFQTFIRKFVGRIAAIFLTAGLFALVHYAGSQGVSNFQLILSLFILSLFLSFIYEREQTLWAPIALHMSFNLSSALLIFFQS